MSKIINRDHFVNNKFFYAVLLLALILRVTGINFGYPYIFNIDEPTIIRSAIGLRYSHEIGHFDWGHFTFYFNYIFYFLFIKFRGILNAVGLQTSLGKLIPILWDDPFIFYFITRLINSTLGALTIIPTYLLAKDMFSKKIGLIAALIFSIMPYHVFISHFATPDSFLLFFLTWAIYFSYKFSVSLSAKDITLAAIMFGVSSSIKYNAIILSLILVLLTFYQLKITDRLTPKILKVVFLKLVLFGAVSLITLVVTMPEIITDWDIFWSYEPGKGFLWQLTMNSSPVPLNEYASAIMMRFRNMFIDTGYIPFILMGFALLKTLTDKNLRKNGIIYLTSFVVLFFIVFTARYGRAASHYFLPVYSLLSIIAACGASEIKSKFILSLSFIVLFSFSIVNTAKFIRLDTRRIAMDYYLGAKDKEGVTYIEGSSLQEMDVINNLNSKKAKNGFDLGENDVVLAQTAIQNNDKIKLVETIGNFFRQGPIIYVYKKAF